MSITAKPQISSLVNSLKKLDPNFSTLAEKVTEAVIGSMRTRIQQRGLGLDGVMKYKSEAYKKYRKGRGYGTSFKNLVITGNMLRSIFSTKLTNSKYLIAISQGEQKKAAGNQERDPWFGLSDTELKVVDLNIDDYLRNIKL